MGQKDDAQPFAQRSVTTRAEDGSHEVVTFALHRLEGGAWRLLRLVDAHRPGGPARKPETVFEGFELDDALEAGNGALEDEIAAAEAEEGEDANASVKPFTQAEVQKRLERWFFERA